MAEVIVQERRGNVALITLNRPEVLNALNEELSIALGEALATANADCEIRAVVLTGTGRAFCVGMDLKAFLRGERARHPQHPEWGFGGFVRQAVDLPVIAAVNGMAYGGGAELLLACDLAVAARSARVGLPEVKRGLVAGAGGVIRLPRLLPQRVALELVLTGEPITSEQALAWGLVNRVVDDERVVEEALELATRIAANAPLAVQASKRVVRESARHGSDWDDEIWEVQDQLLTPVFSSEDAIEGARAFAEKRTPDWKNR